MVFLTAQCPLRHMGFSGIAWVFVYDLYWRP